MHQGDRVAGRWGGVAVFALVALGHALGTVIVYQFDHTPSSGVSFFPADGVTLAALLLLPAALAAQEPLTRAQAVERALTRGEFAPVDRRYSFLLGVLGVTLGAVTLLLVVAR
jgi:hypothetical protein